MMDRFEFLLINCHFMFGFVMLFMLHFCKSLNVVSFYFNLCNYVYVHFVFNLTFCVLFYVQFYVMNVSFIFFRKPFPVNWLYQFLSFSATNERVLMTHYTPST